MIGLGRDLLATEHVDLAGLDVGGADEQLHRVVVAQPGEVDQVVQHLGQRIVVAGVRHVGRHHARQRVVEQPARREIHVADRDRTVEQRRLERAVARPLGDRAPETGSGSRAPRPDRRGRGRRPGRHRSWRRRWCRTRPRSRCGRPPSRRSSTPQVKAPWAPPPCRARLTRGRAVSSAAGGMTDLS